MARSVLTALTGVAEVGVSPLGLLVREIPLQRRSIEQTGHRPWPLPGRPWFMGQTWCDLLFAHWPVEPDELRRVVPPQLPLDTYDGAAWIGITPFVVTGFRLRGMPPLPGVSSFPELNVRTYVTVDGKPGIFFHSLDAGSSPAVVAARRTYRLPYFRARASVERGADGVHYASERVQRDAPGAAFSARYRPDGPEPHSGAGSLARWLTERYCLYTLDDRRCVLRADIHHRPWPLERARATIERNTMTDPLAIELKGEPVLHYSVRQDTVIWRLRDAYGE